MKIYSIASGSKGNATIIFNETTTILVDCGVSEKRLKNGLKNINKKLDDVDYVLFTHEHIDHVRGATIFSNQIEYCLKDTIDVPKGNQLELFKEYSFDSIKVMPLKTSHDAVNPCGYRFIDDENEVVYITDTGFLPEITKSYIRNANIYFFESNHDIKMLLQSRRPDVLKERILSYHGHLSNEQSAQYMCDVIGDKTTNILLAHMSEECNEHGVALNTYYDIFKRNSIDLATSKISVYTLNQWEDFLI